MLFYLISITTVIHVQYKPSNYKFANQGGVSSSARTLRLNYNSITNSGKLFSDAYGTQVGNALAYGGSPDAYTEKTKIGVKMPCIPKFSKHKSGFQKCDGPTPFLVQFSLLLLNTSIWPILLFQLVKLL